MGVGDADAVCSRLSPFRSFGGLPAARSDRPRRQVRQLGGVLRQAIPAQMWLVPAQMWLWSRRRRGWFPAPICAVRSLSSRCGPVPAPHAISTRQGRPGRASAVGLCASNAAGFEPPTATRTGGGATGCGAGTQSITPRWYGPKRERQSGNGPKWEQA
jgi:hypothetical protein